MNADLSSHKTRLVFIAGMHRSGSSVTTRLLNLHGVAIPQDVIPADNNNQRGYWESNELITINEMLLNRLDSNWSDMSIFSDKQLVDLAQGTIGTLAKDFLIRETKHHELLALKDPRLARLLPFWLHICREINITPTILITYRHPEEVAHSLLHRDGIPLALGYLLYCINLLPALKSSLSLSRAFIDYQMVIHDWKAAISPVINQLQLQVENQQHQLEEAINAFIAPELKHNTQTDQQPADDISQLAYDLYEMLQAEPVTTDWVDDLMKRLAEVTSPYLAITQWYATAHCKVANELSALKALSIYSRQAQKTARLTQTLTSIAKHRPIAIWGAGEGGKQIQQLLKTQGIEISYFIDVNSSKAGKLINGIEVNSTDLLFCETKIKPFVVVGSMYYAEIAQQLLAGNYQLNKDFRIILPGASLDRTVVL